MQRLQHEKDVWEDDSIGQLARLVGTCGVLRQPDLQIPIYLVNCALEHLQLLQDELMRQLILRQADDGVDGVVEDLLQGFLLLLVLFKEVPRELTRHRHFFY